MDKTVKTMYIRNLFLLPHVFIILRNNHHDYSCSGSSTKSDMVCKNPCTGTLQQWIERDLLNRF